MAHTADQALLGRKVHNTSTHNFLRMVMQKPGMSIQDWYASVRIRQFKVAVNDRIQYDLTVIGFNDT